MIQRDRECVDLDIKLVLILLKLEKGIIEICVGAI
jgi:hypothetical protein